MLDLFFHFYINNIKFDIFFKLILFFIFIFFEIKVFSQTLLSGDKFNSYLISLTKSPFGSDSSGSVFI